MHMVHMVVVVMMVMVMMVMVHCRSGRFGRHWRIPGGRAGRCFLRDGVSGEAERENGRGRKGLDHGRTFLW